MWAPVRGAVSVTKPPIDDDEITVAKIRSRVLLQAASVIGRPVSLHVSSLI
jgi:hypothetical protein